MQKQLKVCGNITEMNHYDDMQVHPSDITVLSGK